MLEKFGLPEKPSLRGNTWVVDASHCQGCCSQFTFWNRKHHCQRCGGIFCNTCTQQRMILRGQGDSPVRICDPCKRLEDASRFEMRYGNRNKSAKGSSRTAMRHGDKTPSQITGIEGGTFIRKPEHPANLSSHIQRTEDNSFCSNENMQTIDKEASQEIETISPEKLRLQALQEKEKFRILKAEKKHEEALRVFKHAKELERKAEALDIALRKKKRVSAALEGGTVPLKRNVSKGCESNSQISSQRNKKDDFESELRELGWSNADLHDAESIQAKMTVEGALSSLMSESSRGPDSEVAKGGINKGEVLALKKKALALKREGKLAEAKEELKRAKIREKEIEEQELLVQTENSDDELSALIHSVDDDKQGFSMTQDFGFNNFLGTIDENFPGNVDVTDDDLNDPDMVAALKSFGWEEDVAESVVQGGFPLVNQELLQNEILSLKRTAVQEKQVGNSSKAMELLKKIKLLEKDLENLQSESQASSTMTTDHHNNTMKSPSVSSVSKSKLSIQRELLDLKKRALVLRREGRLSEADEELKRGKILELQLDEMNNVSTTTSKGNNLCKIDNGHYDQSVFDEQGEKDEDNQDGNEQDLLLMLKNPGCENEFAISQKTIQSDLSEQPEKTMKFRSRLEIQRELLSVKRKSLNLRRQGKSEEADEELRKAKILESQMEEVDTLKKESHSNPKSKKQNDPIQFDNLDPLTIREEEPEITVDEQDLHDPDLLSLLQDIGWKEENSVKTPIKITNKKSKERIDDSHMVHMSAQLPTMQKNKAEIQRELLGIKRKALNLRRQGKFEEAEEEMKKGNIFQAQLEELEVPYKELQLKPEINSPHTNMPTDTYDKSNRIEETVKSANEPVRQEPTAYRNEVDIQKEILNSKREILKLRHEGKFDESEEELRKANSLESQMVDMEILTNKTGRANQKELDGSRDNLHSKIIPPNEEGVTNNINELEKQGSLFFKGFGLISENADSVRIPSMSLNQVKEIPWDEKLKHETDEDFLGLKPNDPRKSRVLEEQTQDLHANPMPERLDNYKSLIGAISDDFTMQNVKQSSYLSQQDYDSTIIRTSQTPKEILKQKAEMQKELLTLKREALLLRRQGKHVESNEKLAKAKILDSQLEEMEAVVPSVKDSSPSSSPSMSMANLGYDVDFGLESSNSSIRTSIQAQPNQENLKKETEQKMNAPGPKFDSSGGLEFKKDSATCHQEVLTLKRRALALKREGKLAEAREELQKAKLLERRIEENDQSAEKSAPSVSSMDNSSAQETKTLQKPIASRDRFKMQQESLAHKRQALKLRREGKIEEAESELALAKALEAQLEEISPQTEENDDVSVPSFLDPQLLAALKAVGLQDIDPSDKKPKRLDIQSNSVKSKVSHPERDALEESMKAEKAQALTFKREGKQAEALAALRRAKQIEKKLNSMT